ncbi:calcium-binding protein [Plantactinospora sp. S1510]|uniref:Calcium-binding protein n=1 Tax=Plantactinospora alkalitolerans TaxID=2789879 RepID=A0ABS0H1J3_9ACTN|nr:M91 family zinc metallopeptidase [Plantactinospora alkalitolerans]MBF9132333.1 calcium-binding protein [Plantactinospora alkalitolerans]
MALPPEPGGQAPRPAIVVADLWDLAADPGKITAAATAWRGYATSALGARETVDNQAAALRGDAWKGTTSDTYHAHRGKLGDDVEETATAAKAVATSLDDVAGWLTRGQAMLRQILSEITGKVPATRSGAGFTFQPRTEDEEKAVHAAVKETQEARRHYDGELLRCVGELEKARAGLTATARSWTSVVTGSSDGWTLPPEASAGTTVIRVGDDVVINTGTGDDKVTITTDPKTGEQLVTVNGTTMRYPADAHIVMRTGEGNDEINVPTGTRVDLTLLGGEGDDRIHSGDGRDIILGNDGQDRIESGAGDDRASGGADRDYLDGYRGNDVLTGGHGDDTVYGLSGDDRISGGEGRDYLEGATGNDSIDGGAGNDMISGGRDNDVIRAGGGADTVYTGHGADRVDGGSDASSVSGEPDGDTVYGQAEDTSSGTERVVTVELKDLGKHITIEGSDEFKERTQADLDMLRASPRGQLMLDALDQAHENSKAPAADWPILGGIAYQGDTFTIKEMTIDNGRANQNDTTFGKTWSQHPSIEYNPRFTTLHDGPPVVVLYHEMSHVYDFENSGLDDREYTGSDNPDTPNYERAAAGLPIDHDGDPNTPNIIDPNQRYEYTENGLRDELGAPNRPRY